MTAMTAMTAVRGTQEVTLFPGARVDGVFGMWFGKGPGLDRSMDVLKHANAVGTSQYAGVHARLHDNPLAQEERLNLYKICAARELARARRSSPTTRTRPGPGATGRWSSACARRSAAWPGTRRSRSRRPWRARCSS